VLVIKPQPRSISDQGIGKLLAIRVDNAACAVCKWTGKNYKEPVGPGGQLVWQIPFIDAGDRAVITFRAVLDGPWITGTM